MNFANWPFISPANRLPVEEERWWETCYLPSAEQSLAEGYSQGCVILGDYQSGRSTLLAALKRSSQPYFLVVEDDYLSQPAQESPPGNALYRLIRQAVWTIREHLCKRPELLAQIHSRTILEFLRWGIEKFHGRRAFLRWLDRVPEDIAAQFNDMPFEDFYPTQQEMRDVQGQIEELINLSQKLGYQGVLYLVDVTPFPSPAQIKELQALLGWRELMHHHGLKLLLALPPILPRVEIQRLLRDRLPILEMTESREFIWTVISRHLKAASDGQIQSLEQICEPVLLQRLEDLLKEEFGRAPLGGWLRLAGLIMGLINNLNEPLKEESFETIRRLYFTHFCPLHSDPDPARLGIWRGYRWIELERSLYEFLQMLAQASHPVDHTVARTTKSNLHTLASRLRKAIEPAKEYIYIKNTKGEGYILENYSPIFL
ncbi:MAG: helix-turn-helix domain-containing protein [Candidatus Methanomethyliaceae archaeon]